ncbi:MAG TPA: hypothetical protein ENK80_00560, partial [Rhodobacterales bacterium]|nr:hypothetical protein [Rhodobacterales bacterium]
MGLPGGVTVRCRTLQPVARASRESRNRGEIQAPPAPVKPKIPCACRSARALSGTAKPGVSAVTKKPKWVVEKERSKRAAAAQTLWLFGLHAVRDALMNPAREKLRLIVTRNAADRLGEAIAASGMTAELADARKFPAPIDPGSVHQGAALEVKPLDWGKMRDLCAPHPRAPAPRVVLLDR